MIVLISFLHAMFMKIGENDSAHELAKMCDFIYLFFNGMGGVHMSEMFFLFLQLYFFLIVYKAQ